MFHEKMLLLVVVLLLPSFVLNSEVSIGVHHNNAIDIADTTDTQLDERLLCNDEEVFDIKMNRCVRFACPPNFKVSREEYKCKPVRQRNRKRNTLKTELNCTESLLEKFSRRLFANSLKRLQQGRTSLDLSAKWSIPCAKWITVHTRYLNLTASCQLNYQNVHIPKEQLYLQKRRHGNIWGYFCATYYYKSQCLLHFVNISRTSIDMNNKSLIVKTAEKDIPYSLDKFVPLGKMFGVCVVPKPLVLRENTVRNFQSSVSAVGSSLGIMFYIVVLGTFLSSNEHFPGYGVISVCCCSIISDCISLLERILYLGDVVVPIQICKCLAVVNLLVMLTEQLCIVLLAIDHFITFKRVAIHINESIKVYYKRRICSLIIPFVLTLLALVLDYTGPMHHGIGRTSETDFCMLQGFGVRVVFYTIPVVVSFGIAMCLMSLTLLNIRRHINKAAKSSSYAMNDINHNTDNHNNDNSNDDNNTIHYNDIDINRSNNNTNINNNRNDNNNTTCRKNKNILQLFVSFITAMFLITLGFVKRRRIRQTTKPANSRNDNTRIHDQNSQVYGNTDSNGNEYNNNKKTKRKKMKINNNGNNSNNDDNNIINNNNKNNNYTNQRNKNNNLKIRETVITALKLVVVYGLLDVFGFLHLPFKSMIGVEVNVVLGFIYSTVRSLRGLLFFLIYICK